MTRQQLIEHIKEIYGVTEDYPWENDNVSAVFRHPNNKKWFAVALNISAEKLGLNINKQIDIVNVKCDPLMIGSIVRENGIYPAYHMNKNYWISIALDGSADDEKIKWLLDMSFDATNTKIKAK